MSGATTGGTGARLPRRLLLVGLIVVLGTAMSNLDATVVNVTLPALGSSFRAPLGTVQWVVTGYTLALACSAPLASWGIDRYGTRAVFMTSVAIFISGSALAAAATSIGSLIGFRILQGLGAGALMPTGMTIMARVGGRHSGQIMSIVGIPMLLVPIAGPVVGGWLTSHASWRWIFLINIPTGVLAIALAARLLQRDPLPAHRTLDVVGLLLLAPGVGALVYGLTSISATGAGRQGLAWTATGAALSAAFIAHALRGTSPLINLRVLGDRAVAGAAASLALFSAALLGALLLVPLYLQTLGHRSALAAGIVLVPQGLGAAAAMPVTGRLVDRVNPGRLLVAGLLVAIAGLLGVALSLTPSAGLAWLCIAQLALGAGMGMTMMPTLTGALRAVGPAEIAGTSTLLNIIQRIAGSCGTAAMATLVTAGLHAGLRLEPAHAAIAFQHAAGAATILLGAALAPALFMARSLDTARELAEGAAEDDMAIRRLRLRLPSVPRERATKDPGRTR